MADIDKNPATLLAELAALDPPQRRDVAAALRRVADMFAGGAPWSGHRPHIPAAGSLARSECTGDGPLLRGACGTPCQRRRWPRLIRSWRA